MNYVKVVSSTIESLAYDSETSTLAVCFKNGSEYHYYRVPEQIYSKLMTSDSVGKCLNENVKKAGFDYRKVK